MPRARLADVAARAGVSTATVSLVLRDQPGPSAATREAVQAAAAALDYRPDRTASLLARHRSRLLGVLLDVTSSFHGELVVALDDAASERGLELVLSTTTPRRVERAAIETLLDFRCEGLILLGPQATRRELGDLADRAPVVVVGRAGIPRVPGVLAADDVGLSIAVDHLVALGHERIAFVAGPRGSIAAARRKGYRAAMRRHGIPDRATIVGGGQTEEDGARAAAAVLELAPSARPTAVVCFNDRCAIGLRDSLIRADIAVPRDVSVVGYDDSPPARLGTVDLTSVSQDPGALATATIDVVDALIEAGSAGARSGAVAVGSGDVVVRPRLVVRGSSGAVRGPGAG